MHSHEFGHGHGRHGHNHSHHHAESQQEQDERSVTRWLNTMEASLANPQKSKFSMEKFSNQDIKAINAYIDSHEKSLGRYEKFLPPLEIETKQQEQAKHKEKANWNIQFNDHMTC